MGGGVAAGDGSCGSLLVDVSRGRLAASPQVEATPHGWSIYHVGDKVNIVDGNGVPVLKEHLLMDLGWHGDGGVSGAVRDAPVCDGAAGRAEGDVLCAAAASNAGGAYSAWMGTRESGCREGRRIRFTPSLELIPDNVFEVNGCRIHAFQSCRTRRSPVVRHDTLRGREYTLSLELESQRYVKVYSWNTEWVVMVSDTTEISFTPLACSFFAASMNHFISANCLSLLKVEGWNSLSTHFLAAASSAWAWLPSAHATAMARAV